MSPVTEARLGGIAIASLLGVVVPAFLLGPVIFGGASLSSLPGWAVPASIGLAAYGAWLLLVSALAQPKEIEFILGIFQANELAVLLLPAALFVGTRSIIRRLLGPQKH